MNGETEHKTGVIGAWDVEVTLRNRATGVPIKTLHAVNIFIADGVLTETGGHATPNVSSPGQGTWRHISERNYTAALRGVRFNPDGSIAETRKVTRRLELSNDGMQFTGTTSVEIFDSKDNLILSQCATESAKRLNQ